MSLQDESFPADDLFDIMECSAASANRILQRQFSIRLNIDHHFDSNVAQSPPFLNSDCSEKTCASDPVCLSLSQHETEATQCDAGNNDEEQSERQTQAHKHSHTNLQLGSGRSSKAVSYQDIHSAYTKKRYQHVTSKVRKYIAEIDNEGQKKRNSSTGTFQRHRSMPECLTPRNGGEDQEKLDKSLSLENSSETETHIRDESYERLINEKQSLQSYINHLEENLYKKVDDYITLKKNFDFVRDELDKLKRQSVFTGASKIGHSSLHSLMHCPKERIARATQTDVPFGTAHHISNISDMSDMPAIAANATPHLNANLNDITYDSSAGSIEIPLLSVPPAARQLKPIKAIKQSNDNMKPLSLNFSNDSAEVDANGNDMPSAGTRSNNNLQPNSSNRIVPNNSGSSHPSSNDSAIEIEVHESRSPRPSRSQPHYRGQAMNFSESTEWKRDRMIFIEKHSNRLVELVPINKTVPLAATGTSNASADNSNSTQSQSFDMIQYGHICRRKRTLASRMLHIFGPCGRCTDPNQTMDVSAATYTVEIALLGDESNRSHTLR